MFLRYVEVGLLDTMRTGLDNIAFHYRRQEYPI